MSHEARLSAARITLPESYPSAGLYEKSVQVGDILYVGGHGPVTDGDRINGKVGPGGSVTLEQARHAARLTGLQILTSVRLALGTLDRVERVVKVLGMVNCAPGFNQTPAVIDGCSELFHEVFGEAGKHTRSAVGLAELPFDIPVEIEAIFQVTPS
jgi:enamine deaminase RidA (YjgF/YER057c/UK114 family)